MDTLLSLRVLSEVAEHRNFSVVAERMGLSPAMTSKHVQHIEARVGARLLNRNSRNVSLTEAGSAPQPMRLERMAAMSDAVPIAEGEVTISASVTMVFELATP